MIVRVDRSNLVQPVHRYRVNPSGLYEIRPCSGPIRIIPDGVSRHQTPERNPLRLFNSSELSMLTVIGVHDFSSPKMLSQTPARGGKVRSRQVDVEVYCPAPTKPGFVVKPQSARDDNVVIFVLRTGAQTLRSHRKSVQPEHFSQRNGPKLCDRSRLDHARIHRSKPRMYCSRDEQSPRGSRFLY